MIAGCALCGRSAFTRRLDVIDADVDAQDTGDYEVRGVLRGVLLCPECLTRPIGELLGLAGGVSLVRGCLVQCSHQPPWWLRRALPAGPRMWSKVTCPACGGRASIQVIADAVQRPRGALREGLRQALGVLSLRNTGTEGDDYGMAGAGHYRADRVTHTGPEDVPQISGFAHQAAPEGDSMARIQE